jgi:hypothetical protein
MRNLQPTTIQACQGHLRRQRTGVSLDLAHMPGPVSDYTAFNAELDQADLDRIFLWGEHRIHTAGETAKLTDAKPEAAGHKRIKPLIEGDAAKGWEPIDLRTATGFEPTFVTNDLEKGPLFGIDGNHRLIAQFLMGKGFDGVPVFVCTHPRMLEWPYVFHTARNWFNNR